MPSLGKRRPDSDLCPDRAVEGAAAELPRSLSIVWGGHLAGAPAGEVTQEQNGVDTKPPSYDKARAAAAAGESSTEASSPLRRTSHSNPSTEDKKQGSLWGQGVKAPGGAAGPAEEGAAGSARQRGKFGEKGSLAAAKDSFGMASKGVHMLGMMGVASTASSSVARKTRKSQIGNLFAAEEELKKYEALQQMRQVFDTHDMDSDGLITATELRYLAGRLCHDQWKLEKIQPMLDHFRCIARHHDPDAEWNDDDPNHDHGIPFEIFADILYSDEAEENLSPDMLDAVRMLRAFFRDSNNARTLATAADVNVGDLHMSHKGSLNERLHKHLDIIMGVVIITNALTIGISLDHDWDGWEALEYFYVTLYTLEVLYKISYTGFWDFLLGYEWHWNMFDTCLVFVGQLGLVLKAVTEEVNLGQFMFIRLLRVARLVRLVRLVRAFKELSIMVTGLLAGMKTMTWAMFLLFMCVYSMAVLLTSVVGRDPDADFEHREYLFATVTNSMFTVFVCLSDGCTSLDGTPISHHLYREYGVVFFLCYCFAVVLVNFGLFNLIMAIFVENTMQSARSNDQKISAARHAENLRIARKLRMVIRQFSIAKAKNRKDAQAQSAILEAADERFKANRGLRGLIRRWHGGKREEEPLDEMFTDTEFKVTRDEFEAIIARESVQELLDELEIDESDRKGLFEVLDADGSGTLSIEELVSGLMAVRGQAKKSDTIATMLAVKSVQKSLRNTATLMLQNQKTMQESLEHLGDRLNLMEARLHHGSRNPGVVDISMI